MDVPLNNTLHKKLSNTLHNKLSIKESRKLGTLESGHAPHGGRGGRQGGCASNAMVLNRASLP